MATITTNKGSEYTGVSIGMNLGFPSSEDLDAWQLDGVSFNGNILDSIGNAAYVYYYMPELRISDTIVQAVYNEYNTLEGDTSCLGFEYICVPRSCGPDGAIYTTYDIYALVNNKTMLQCIGYAFLRDDNISRIRIYGAPNENYTPGSQPS